MGGGGGGGCASGEGGGGGSWFSPATAAFAACGSTVAGVADSNIIMTEPTNVVAAAIRAMTRAIRARAHTSTSSLLDSTNSLVGTFSSRRGPPLALCILPPSRVATTGPHVFSYHVSKARENHRLILIMKTKKTMINLVCLSRI